MTVPADTTPPAPAPDGADEGGAQAARERQSHVRHELRAPLAVIYPLLSLLVDGESGALSPQQREHLVVLERNVERLEALVTGVVDSGWSDYSAAPAKREQISPLDLAESVAALRRLDRSGGPAVIVKRAAPPTPRAWADADDVRQIVTALIRNATTYTPSSGLVSVSMAPADDSGTVTLEVADTGPGMSPEELARAFEFGFRGEAATRVKAPGLGIGLWVCRRLAERSDGLLALASEPGGGVRATLTLPAAAS